MKRINIYSIKQVKEKGGLYDLPYKRATSPESAYRIIESVLELSMEPVEKFGILTLNTKGEIAGVHVLHIGDLNSTIVSPRRVFQACLLNNAASFICFHNHPSGNPAPSEEDIALTRRLEDGARLLGIQLTDHIIVGDDRYISLKDKGYC